MIAIYVLLGGILLCLLILISEVVKLGLSAHKMIQDAATHHDIRALGADNTLRELAGIYQQIDIIKEVVCEGIRRGAAELDRQRAERATATEKEDPGWLANQQARARKFNADRRAEAQERER